MSSVKYINVSFVTLTTILILMIVSATTASYTRFVLAKDYKFQIEAPCDNTTEECFQRSCDEYCPPNGLELYRVFSMPAKYYSQCTDNSCLNVCEHKGKCTEITCSVGNGDSCYKPTNI